MAGRVVMVQPLFRINQTVGWNYTSDVVKNHDEHAAPHWEEKRTPSFFSALHLY